MSHNFRHWLMLCPLALLASVSLRAQQADPLTRIQTAARNTSLDQDGLHPWHVKLSVQLFDEKGKPSEKGTIEQWWTAPGIERIVYAFPSYTATVARTKDEILRTQGTGSPPYFVEYLRRQVVHPMPTVAS